MVIDSSHGSCTGIHEGALGSWECTGMYASEVPPYITRNFLMQVKFTVVIFIGNLFSCETPSVHELLVNGIRYLLVNVNGLLCEGTTLSNCNSVSALSKFKQGHSGAYFFTLC